MNLEASIPHASTIPAVVNKILGKEVTALALVCSVGSGEHASILAYITPGSAASSPRFLHAIELERSYSDTLLSFEMPQEPYYGNATPMNMCHAASMLGVDKLLCMVALDTRGGISAVRDYGGLEVTQLESAQAQFDRFKELLDCVTSHRPGSLQ